MVCILRSVHVGNYKLIYNIAHWLPYPIASDLFASPSFQVSCACGGIATRHPRVTAAAMTQDLLARNASGQPTHWYRSINDYMLVSGRGGA